MSESDFEQLKQDGLSSSVLAPTDLADVPLTQLLADAEMAASGKQVKDALIRNAVFINGVAKSFDDNMRANKHQLEKNHEKNPKCADPGGISHQMRRLFH